MNTNKSNNQLYKMRVSDRKPVAKPKFINLDYLKEISSDNESFIAALLTTFRDESKRIVVKLRNQLSADEFTNMEKTAHAMKPTGVYIGANSLTVLVGQLEVAAHNSNRNQANTLIAQIQNMVEIILKEIDEYLYIKR